MYKISRQLRHRGPPLIKILSILTVNSLGHILQHIESKLILDVAVIGRGTDPAATLLHRLAEKYDLIDTVFLDDGDLTTHSIKIK